MNKTEFVKRFAKATGQTIEASKKSTDCFLNLLAEGLKEGHVISFIGFGTFKTRKMPKRIMRSPGTNKEVEVPESISPCFKAGASLKKKVNE